MNQLDTSKTLFIMGNGPSLGEIMNNPEQLSILKQNHTFGLNAAYRAYGKYNFYPTYFGCFDYVINGNHKDAFENLVMSDNEIEQFYFIGNSEQKQNLYHTDVQNNNRFVKFNFKHVAIDKFPSISQNFDEYYNPGSSGANALQIGIMLGYKKIVLLGCDCNYNNKIDKENILDTEIRHISAWKNIRKYCPEGFEIINCSENSKIESFVKLNFVKSLNKIYHNDVINNYTFIIKTFERYDCLENLLRSIEKYYFGVKIIVCDDSINKQNINNLFSYNNLNIIDKYTDIGLSAGRNRLIEIVETKYFLLLDDDFLIDDTTNIGFSYEIIKNGFDIVGGEVYDFGPSSSSSNQPRDFYGTLLEENSNLLLYKQNVKGYHNNYPLYDFVLNFFVGNTKSFINNKWDDNLKLGEHLDFFIRFDKSLKITYSTKFQIKHYQDTISKLEYNKYRSRVHEYLKHFKDKHSIKDIITIKDDNFIKIKG